MRNRKSFQELLRAINSYGDPVFCIAAYYMVFYLIAFGIGAVVHWVTGWRGPVWVVPVAAGIGGLLFIVAVWLIGPTGPE